MDIDIRERLEEEMTKCNSLRLYKSRVRKINNIFPDEVVENILSFTSCRCKKCVKTRKVIENEYTYVKSLRNKWDGFDIEEKMFSEEYTKYQQDGLKIWLYYFIKLNRFPSIKTLNRYDKHAYNNLKCVYGLYDLPIRSWKYKKEFKDVMVWMLCTRGCQFYPQLFNGEFQRAVISEIDKEILWYIFLTN